MNRYPAQRNRKAWLAALASGLIILLVIGLGLLQENASTLALTEAQANATRQEAHWRAFATAVQANATQDEATWRAVATYAPDKATQRAIQQLTVTFLPTPTWFDGLATGEALDKMLTTSPTPGPTNPPMLFFQRPAGAGRLVFPMGMCGDNLKCVLEDLWVEKTKDKFIMVYAGHSVHTNGSLEAQINIEWSSLNNYKPLSVPGDGMFPVPIPAQHVMIVDAIGEQLLLRTNDGALLIFDVPSQQYISIPPLQLKARMQHQATTGAIHEKSDLPFTQPGFSAFNRWSGKNGKGQITVFAGGNNQNFFLGKGMLAVVTSEGEPTAADGTSPSGDIPQVYSPSETDLPGPGGALWIFDVKGNLVALLDHRGSAFFFDLTTRQFISRSDERMSQVFAAPLFDPNMPISQATPAPMTPFAPPTPVSTPVPNAYP